MRFTGLSEFVVYGLLFAALILFNLWMQRRGRLAREQRRPAEAEQGQPVPEPSKAPAGAMDVSWGRALPPDRPPRPIAVPPVRRAPPPVPRPAPGGHRALFRSRDGMRQAVVAMTVLGPCRALEPYGSSPGPAARGAGRDAA